MFSRYQIAGFTEDYLQPWLFQVSPYPEESFSHFLGRFRRANHLSHAHLSVMLKQKPYVVSYWETPSRRRLPSPTALQHLSQLTGVAAERLRSMGWPLGVQIHFPTRLCAECYAESPHHRLSWQLAERAHCALHKRPLLSRCPQCRQSFQLPSYWQSGACDSCHYPFHKMTVSQQDLSSSV